MRYSCYTIPFLIILMLGLAGCGLSAKAPDQSQMPQAEVPPVTDSSQMGPLEKHMLARKHVDPNDIDGTELYIEDMLVPPEYEPYHMTLVPGRKPGSEPMLASAASAAPAPSPQQLAALRRMMPAKMQPNQHLIVSEEDLDKIQQHRALDNHRVVQPAHRQAVQHLSAPPLPPPQMEPQRQVKPLLQAQPQPAARSDVAVIGVRTGRHPDKTRLVFDLDGPSGFSYTLDNQQRVLVVELPGAAWEMPLIGAFNKYPVLESYTATPRADGGTTVSLKLKSRARVLFAGTFEPNAQMGYRIVIDVAPF